MNKEIAYLNFESATYRLVLLHGWGADAEDLIPLAKEIIETDQFVLNIASLRAPQFHPQGFGRMWYPLFPHDWEAVPHAVNELERRIIAIATDSIPLQKTILLGFSQGGAMALEMASRLSLAGVIACSSYSHPCWTPKEHMPPIFFTHGCNDEIVPIDEAKKTINLLKRFKINSNLFTFTGGHEIPNLLIKEIKFVIASWLN